MISQEFEVVTSSEKIPSCSEDEFLKDRLKNRIVVINNAIDEDVIETTSLHLLKMEKQDKQKPVKIIFNSLGGDLYEGIHLYDVINNLVPPTYTYAFGKCMSAAFLGFMGGEVRIAFPNSIFLIHSIKFSTENSNTSVLKDETRFITEASKRLVAEFRFKTNKPASYWNRILFGKTEKYFFADQAHKEGIIHQLLTKKENGKWNPYENV